MVSHKVCDQPEVSAALCSLKLLIYCVCLRTQSLARSLIIYIGLEIPLVSVMVSYKLCGQSEVSAALCTLKLLIYCVCLRTQGRVILALHKGASVDFFFNCFEIH